MAITPKQIIAPRYLPNGVGAEEAIYTCPTGTKCVIRKLTFTNPTAGSINYTVYIVPSGDTSADDTIVIDALAIGAGLSDSPDRLIGHVLEAGGMIRAFASGASSINVVGSGTEVV